MKVMKGELEIATKVDVANTLIKKTIGLMFSKNLGDRDGLLITSCNSIHTCFMRYNLDIVFLSSDNKVIKVIRNMKPWRMTWMYFKASKVLEMMGGTLPADINAGDEFIIDV